MLKKIFDTSIYRRYYIKQKEEPFPSRVLYEIKVNYGVISGLNEEFQNLN